MFASSVRRLAGRAFSSQAAAASESSGVRNWILGGAGAGAVISAGLYAASSSETAAGPAKSQAVGPKAGAKEGFNIPQKNRCPWEEFPPQRCFRDAEKEKNYPKMTLDDVQADHGEDVWVTLDGGVYNVTYVAGQR